MERLHIQMALGAVLVALCIPHCSDNDSAETGDTTTTPAPTAYIEEDCAESNPNKNLYFGDLHVHTQLSFDAYGYEVRTAPIEAYGFAQGDAVALPPLNDEGIGTREVHLDRPLDFAAVTDHLEFFSEVRLCTDPSSPVYDAGVCANFREGGSDNVTLFGTHLASYSPTRIDGICDSADVDCQETIQLVWNEVIDAANEAYDWSSDCSFTTFIGYEFTSTPEVTNLHRNVIFKNTEVPTEPVSYFEEWSPEGLWRSLQRDCLELGTGCDVLVIPHNSNWSNGQLYTPEYAPELTLDEQAELASLRARFETTAEIFQHKGDMECQNGFAGLPDANDPLCDFEKLNGNQFVDCGDSTGVGGVAGFGCASKLDYMRNVFKQGILELERLGINPYTFGVIGSTDTHNGTAGLTREEDFPGHVGITDDTPTKRLGPGTITHTPSIYNPGGLAAVWAEENRRDAIFEAMERGETYGTSGTRIGVRFFGSFAYTADLCDQSDRIEVGYADGVPMGGTLPETPSSQTAPTFLVESHSDAGTAQYPGTPLQRIEIVKGWIDSNGDMRETVFQVAGDPGNGADVDPTSCELIGSGFERLCSVWTDPDFDSNLNAFYYARVVENPSCRWAAYDCARFDSGSAPEACDVDGVPLKTQERAWTSPIWYNTP